MGLDFSHGGGYLWSYSGYADFIMRLQDEAALHPSRTKPDPIQAMIDHSGCEGFFEPWDCDSEFGDEERERAEQMAKGMQRAIRQPALWGELDRDRREQAWKVMDKLNATLGRDTVRILGAGPKDAAWKLKAEHRSPRWTTRWDELPKVRAQ